MSDVTLTPEEIFDITGMKQPAAQIRHLRRMGIKAERSHNPDRPVCVCRDWLLTAQARIAAQSPTTPRLKSERHHGTTA